MSINKANHKNIIKPFHAHFLSIKNYISAVNYIIVNKALY